MVVWEHLQGASQETCDIWFIKDMSWEKDKDKIVLRAPRLINMAWQWIWMDVYCKKQMCEWQEKYNKLPKLDKSR